MTASASDQRAVLESLLDRVQRNRLRLVEERAAAPSGAAPIEEIPPEVELPLASEPLPIPAARGAVATAPATLEPAAEAEPLPEIEPAVEMLEPEPVVAVAAPVVTELEPRAYTPAPRASAPVATFNGALPRSYTLAAVLSRALKLGR